MNRLLLLLCVPFLLVFATAAYPECVLVHQEPEHYKQKDGRIDYEAMSKEANQNGAEVVGYVNDGTPEGYQSVDTETNETYNYTKGCPKAINKFLDAESLCMHYDGELLGDG